MKRWAWRALTTSFLFSLNLKVLTASAGILKFSNSLPTTPTYSPKRTRLATTLKPVSRHLDIKIGNLNINVVSDFRSRKHHRYHDFNDESKFINGIKKFFCEFARLMWYDFIWKLCREAKFLRKVPHLTIKNLGSIKNCELDLSKMLVLDGRGW